MSEPDDGEQRLRLALAASRMGAWSVDLGTGDMAVDDRVANVLDLSAADVPTSLAALVDGVIHPDDRSHLVASLTRASKGDDAEFSVEVRLAGPRSRWILVSGGAFDRPQTSGSGRLLTGTMLDITDRKATEEALAARVTAQADVVMRTERRYRALVEASSQIVWMADAEGRVIDDSRQWRAFTGQPVGELRERGWLAAVHADDRSGVEAQWWESVTTVTPFHEEFRIRHQSTDSWHWVSMRAVPVPDGDIPETDVRSAGWIAMIADVDERRRANEDIRTLASTLTMAEHEERRRISRVLHDDLQQRLYSTQMRIMTAAETAAAESRNLEHQLTQIEAMVADSIEVTRHLAVELSPPILQHEGLAETLGWLAADMAEMHGLHVDVRSEQSYPIDDNDMRVFLFQLTRELLFNVVKHADVESATVTLSADDDDLVICVADDGLGFEPADAGRVGAGLGLTTINERLRLFGGRMDVESAPGDGAAVTITVPLASRR